MSIVDMDNPIIGTTLDPLRKLYLRMSGAGTGTGAGVGAPSTDAGPMSERTPIGGDSVNMPQIGPLSGMRPTSLPVPTAVTTPHTGSPTAPLGESPEAREDLDDDALFQSLMKQGMDDTPAVQRIRDLQGQWDTMHKPQGWKGRLLNLGVSLAPVAIGGIFGGSEGAAGAAEGVSEIQDIERNTWTKQENDLRMALEAERQRQERQYERRLQLPVSMASMRMLRDYRRGMLDAANRKADTGQQNADTNSRKAGFRPDGTPLAPNEQSQAQLDAHEMSKAGVQLKDALTDLARARASAIPSQIELARKRLQATMSSMSLGVRKFYADYYGIDSETGEYIQGAPEDEEGNVYGFKAAPDFRPSGQTKSRAEQGIAVLNAGKRLKATLQAHRGEIGNPEAIVKSIFLGTPVADPKLAFLAADIASFAALQPALHGFRSQEALQEFHRIIGGNAKDPDAIIAAIDGILETAQNVKDTGMPRVHKGGGKATGSAVEKLQPSAPSKPMHMPPGSSKASDKLNKGVIVITQEEMNRVQGGRR